MGKKGAPPWQPQSAAFHVAWYTGSSRTFIDTTKTKHDMARNDGKPGPALFHFDTLLSAAHFLRPRRMQHETFVPSRNQKKVTLLKYNECHAEKDDINNGATAVTAAASTTTAAAVALQPDSGRVSRRGIVHDPGAFSSAQHHQKR
jgi:hypothetical protein